MDVGGTFTDLVALRNGDVLITKVPSTPQNQSEGVISSVRAAEIKAEEVVGFAHGATVATNSLLERRGARTALITTEGFRDVLKIGRQDRPSLYDLTRNRPPTLVPRELRFTVSERMGPDALNTPIEALELEYTLRVERYELTYGSAGEGKYPGGDGIVRSLCLLEPATLSLFTDRRRHGPLDAYGGDSGKPGENLLNDEQLSAKETRELSPGDTVTIRTPGGGGWRRPEHAKTVGFRKRS